MRSAAVAVELLRHGAGDSAGEVAIGEAVANVLPVAADLVFDRLVPNAR